MFLVDVSDDCGLVGGARPHEVTGNVVCIATNELARPQRQSIEQKVL